MHQFHTHRFSGHKRENFEIPDLYQGRYQVLVTKICDIDRISYILTNFTPNISALNNKHFTNWLLNNGPPSAGQTAELHHFKSPIQAFFSFNFGAYR